MVAEIHSRNDAWASANKQMETALLLAAFMNANHQASKSIVPERLKVTGMKQC